MDGASDGAREDIVVVLCVRCLTAEAVKLLKDKVLVNAFHGGS